MTEPHPLPSARPPEPLLDWDEVLRRRERTQMAFDRLKAAIREMDRMIEELTHRQK